MNIRKINNLLFLILSTFLLVACASSHSSKVEDIKARGKLVVATSPDYAPFEFQTLVDGKNKVVGADIQMAQNIADELGVRLEISTMNFANVLTDLQLGYADLAISGLGKTEERAEVFDFSDTYYESKIRLILRKDDGAVYQRLEDLQGKSVAVQKGTIPEMTAQDQLKNSQLVSLTEVGAMMNELTAKKVEAVLLDEAVALNYVANNQDLILATMSLETTDGDANAVALKKGNKELKELVNRVITKQNKEGSYQTYLEEASKLSANH